MKTSTKTIWCPFTHLFVQIKDNTLWALQVVEGGTCYLYAGLADQFPLGLNLSKVNQLLDAASYFLHFWKGVNELPKMLKRTWSEWALEWGSLSMPSGVGYGVWHAPLIWSCSCCCLKLVFCSSYCSVLWWKVDFLSSTWKIKSGCCSSAFSTISWLMFWLSERGLRCWSHACFNAHVNGFQASWQECMERSFI